MLATPPVFFTVLKDSVLVARMIAARTAASGLKS